MEKKPSITKLGDLCCGCGSCTAICPQKCITMVEGRQGFLYPSVDEDKCVSCFQCDRVCPPQNVTSKKYPFKVFWAKSLDIGQLKKSSSGGIFALLAKTVLKEDGIVVGASWDKSYSRVEHSIVDRNEALDSLMRSKYIQSNVKEEIYRSVKESLNSGRRVLFSGTACQIAGMRAYLGEIAASPLFLGVDVICHGVPSPLLWRRWIEYCQSDAHAGIKMVNFRCKETGWRSFSVYYSFERIGDGEKQLITREFSKDWYMRAFLQNASLRACCFSCPSKLTCGSDLTLGDFWGIDSLYPEVDPDNLGVSAVLINSTKGAQAFKSISHQIEFGESLFDEVLKGNPCLAQSVIPFNEYSDFMSAIAESLPIPTLMKKWEFEPSFSQKVKARLRRILNLNA